MNDLVLLLIAALLSGIAVKYADYLEDRKEKSNTFLRIMIGVLYGSLLYSCLHIFPQLKELWIGMIFGLIVTGKIDAVSHYIGVSLFFILLIWIKGLIVMNYWILFMFIGACILEENLNEYMDKGKIEKKTLRKIISIRPIVEMVALIVSIITGLWPIWFALLSFDIGYVITSRIEK